MGERKRVGLREVRALQPGGIAWDAAVPGFGARRQRDAVAYFSSIGPLTGDSGGTRSADTGRRGRQRQRVSKLGVCWEK